MGPSSITPMALPCRHALPWAWPPLPLALPLFPPHQPRVECLLQQELQILLLQQRYSRRQRGPLSRGDRSGPERASKGAGSRRGSAQLPAPKTGTTTIRTLRSREHSRSGSSSSNSSGWRIWRNKRKRMGMQGRRRTRRRRRTERGKMKRRTTTPLQTAAQGSQRRKSRRGPALLHVHGVAAAMQQQQQLPLVRARAEAEQPNAPQPSCPPRDEAGWSCSFRGARCVSSSSS
mmetsp:Transcript_12898/g.34345  ORF Transcript_12898/g.34345 Transcript_12898/m.34345 type:complete len:232 (-) Transcript_12898:858-1553(-)